MYHVLISVSLQDLSEEFSYCNFAIRNGRRSAGISAAAVIKLLISLAIVDGPGGKNRDCFSILFHAESRGIESCV